MSNREHLKYLVEQLNYIAKDQVRGHGGKFYIEEFILNEPYIIETTIKILYEATDTFIIVSVTKVSGARYISEEDALKDTYEFAYRELLKYIIFVKDDPDAKLVDNNGYKIDVVSVATLLRNGYEYNPLGE